MTLEERDWGYYGAHHCNCPDSQTHPGRYCKHIVTVLQRILAVLPQVVRKNGTEFNLLASPFEYRPSPDSHENAMDARTMFYQILHQDAPYYQLVRPAATFDQIIVNAIRFSTSKAKELRLIYDAGANCYYIKTKHECIAYIQAGRDVITNDARTVVNNVTSQAGWYLTRDIMTGDIVHTGTSRYIEYTLTRDEFGARQPLTSRTLATATA